MLIDCKKARRTQTQSIHGISRYNSGQTTEVRFIDVYIVGLARVPFKGMMVAGITVDTDCFEPEKVNGPPFLNF
jgi:hypothetical protein